MHTFVADFILGNDETLSTGPECRYRSQGPAAAPCLQCFSFSSPFFFLFDETSQPHFLSCHGLCAACSSVLAMLLALTPSTPSQSQALFVAEPLGVNEDGKIFHASAQLNATVRCACSFLIYHGLFWYLINSNVSLPFPDFCSS